MKIVEDFPIKDYLLSYILSTIRPIITAEDLPYHLVTEPLKLDIYLIKQHLIAELRM